jgi:hypothetical protein
MNPIAQAITQAITNFFVNLITNFMNNLNGAIGPIIMLVGNTPLNLTTGNTVVSGAWMTMVGVADAFLGLYVIMKMIQMMHGEATGTTHMPIGQFVPKVILTVILIHASSFLGTQLLTLVNALCSLIPTNVRDIITQINGKPLSQGQVLGLGTVLFLVAGFSLIRVVFQAVKRVVLFNVLFVLSGPAFLMSLDAQTAPWFGFWLRTYLVTILEQFLQFLTFGLGFQFLIAAKQTGVTGFILAIAILNLTAEIPSIMSRFASSSGASVSGIGPLVRTAVTAAALFL